MSSLSRSSAFSSALRLADDDADATALFWCCCWCRDEEAAVEASTPFFSRRAMASAYMASPRDWA